MRLSEESNNYGFKVKVGYEGSRDSFTVTAVAYRRILGVFWIRVSGGWYFYEKYVSEVDIDANIESVIAEANEWVHRELLAKSKSD